MSKKINVIQKEGEPEVAADILAKSIVEISDAMKVFNNSRLKRNTIVTLIHSHSKVAKRDIELVMNNLTELANIWLK